MIDPLKYSYYLVLVTEKKKKYDITNFVEDLGWEELENELAARLSCTVKNDKTTKGRISSLSKPGCYLYLYYRYKTGTAQEAMRKCDCRMESICKVKQSTIKAEGL